LLHHRAPDHGIHHGVVPGRDFFLFGGGAMVAWSVMNLFREFVLVTQSYVLAGLF
jgi:hypothetical protein